jgi:hypothetical protein
MRSDEEGRKWVWPFVQKLEFSWRSHQMFQLVQRPEDVIRSANLGRIVCSGTRLSRSGPFGTCRYTNAAVDPYISAHNNALSLAI